MKRIITTVISMATLWVAMSFRPATHGEGAVTVIFEHYVGDSILLADDGVYSNSYGQRFTITKLRYYVGDMCMTEASGAHVCFKDYHLVDESENDSKTIRLNNLPAGQYTGIEFSIGVDSADNCGGAQSGALDPVHAMFWAWNTGYVFLKMEGKAPASASPGHIFEYHIGGYRKPNDCIRRVSLVFKAPVTVGTAGKELYVKVDAGKVISGVHKVDFSKLSSVTDFHNATTIADNYAAMFSILTIR